MLPSNQRPCRYFLLAQIVAVQALCSYALRIPTLSRTRSSITSGQYLSSVTPISAASLYLPSSKTALFLSSPSGNPNDLESPEEREERMKLVRQLQKSYYQGESEGLVEVTDDDPSVIENVPLWRVQWTELPGYQNVLNCHVPHYTHMFRRILSGPKPWLFGHIFLPGGSENLNNPKYQLPDDTTMAITEATLTGTLLQISDYKQLDDGRLALIVQAVERFRIVEATQHVPYAIATVQLDPDQELIKAYALKSDGDPSTARARVAGARLAAVREALLWRDWEFRETTYEDMQTAGVTPLVNYNADSLPLLRDDIEQEAVQTRNEYLEAKLVDTAARVLDTGATIDTTEQVLELEYSVWIAMDCMLRLLAEVNPTERIPVPAQLLGLLPNDRPWPKGFRLQEYAANLESKNAMIGTATKSPFVSVSKSQTSYPPLRRASRLSYAIWILLDSRIPSPRAQALLEETSIVKRLEYAIRDLETINKSLQDLL